MVAIRVDGNSKIGTGHIQRCISIGECLKELGVDPIFIMADNNAWEILNNKGFRFICLGSKWYDMQGEISTLINTIKDYDIETILLDSYNVTSYYTQVIGSMVKLYYIDDFYVNYYENLKGIISYNIGCDISKKIYNSSTQLIIGTAYIPLRREFQDITPVNVRLGVQNILLTTGGTDKYNLVEDILNMFNKILKFKNINFHVIVGKYFSNKKDLEKISSNNNNIILYENVYKMTDVMLKCDMAISAGGTTLYELCICGLPTVSFCIADNQINVTHALHKNKVVLFSGDYNTNINVLLNNILNNTCAIIEDISLRTVMHSNAIKFLDGKGAMRIAQKLI